MEIWEEIRAGAGIPQRSVSEVKEVVNSAVQAASEERNAVSLQAGAIGRDGASLEKSVASMDASVRRSPGRPAQAAKSGLAREQAEKACEGPDVDL